MKSLFPSAEIRELENKANLIRDLNFFHEYFL